MKFNINKTSSNYNLGEFYYYLWENLAEYNSFDSFCRYWLSLKTSSIKNMLGIICLQLSFIMKHSRQNETYYMLPEIFCIEPWRGQNLILELIKKEVRTKKEIITEIDFWGKVDANDL